MIRALVAMLMLPTFAHAEDRIRFVQQDEKSHTSSAVVVPPVALLHTAQILPLNAKGKVPARTVEAQLPLLLQHLKTIVDHAGGEMRDLVKLNIAIDHDDIADVVRTELAKQLPRDCFPSVTFVATPLMEKDIRVSFDAIVTIAKPKSMLAQLEKIPTTGPITYRVLPMGGRVYVAGQAEKGADLKEATRATIQSLKKTIREFGLNDTTMIQLKMFLSPMTEWQSVRDVIVAEFPKDQVPAMVFVEWQSSRDVPIEIELIATTKRDETNAPEVIEFLTPSFMKSSPIYSRVALVRYGPSIYIGGRYGNQEGASEVTDIFDELKPLLKACDTDFQHLAKATYYVSVEETSRALNEVRPKFYDPKRPPAASKAFVRGVGNVNRRITLDLIAVPTFRVPNTPPEYGFGLNKERVHEGWISLFDGATAFGWKDAKVKNGILSGGTTTCSFRHIAVSINAATDGTLMLGTKKIPLPVGKSLFTEKMDGPIRLADGLTIKSISVQFQDLRSLFDGKSMDGWKRIDRSTTPEAKRPKWSIVDGAFVASGGPGAIEYAESFGDFVLQIDAKSNGRHRNGGVFVRSIAGDFMNGYEFQVYNRCHDGDVNRPVFWATGAIDDRQNARRLVSRDGEWFRMTIVANGPHLASWVNGAQVTDWIDDRKPNVNPRNGLRVEPGVIQLQAHDPATEVEFRRIVIQKW